MTNTTEYMMCEQALDVPYGPGQFWELHPGVTVTAEEYDDEGFFVQTWDLGSNAAILEFEPTGEGTYLLYGNQYGATFRSLEANIDGDTLVRLVDAR